MHQLLAAARAFVMPGSAAVQGASGFAAVALAMVLAFAAPVSQAVDLKTAATNGKPYAARFSITASSGTPPTAVTSVVYNTAVTVTGKIVPDPQHTNKTADVFVVDRTDNTWYMRNLDGRWVVWSGRVPDLVPWKERVNLGSEYTVDIYQGPYADPSQHQYYIGYLPAGDSVLLYTGTPALLNVTQAEITVSPLTYFGDHIESGIVQTRCIACHVGGGLAKDSAMVLQRSSATSTDSNFNAFKNLAASKGANYILTKVSGGNNHGGLVQLVAGSADYQALATFLAGLTGSTIKTPANDFFDGVTLQPRVDTLRRAAIMLSGRAPTTTEMVAVASGDESVLRTTLRSLLTGPGFHQFLTDGANDRLLLRGTPGTVIDPSWPHFQTYSQAAYNNYVGLLAAGRTRQQAADANHSWQQVIDNGLRESAGELIAYIAENDRPYTEVVTADYMMMNPRMSQVFEAGLTFTNPNDQTEFRPGRLNGYYLWGDRTNKFILELETARYKVLVPSTKRAPWQHAGVLNTPAFLKRYPSTATNRNRARARWTMFHFLDIDIEKSVQRPTDPAALADTNNPTLNNPACTACHERMDPVAAAFQDYSDQGFYREHEEGLDSLDPFYKYPPDNSYTPYQRGDTWYRDMRAAGLLGQGITMSKDPMQQLGNLISKDPGFARAAVKFWWPSVMNADVLAPPAVSSDTNYQDKLTAYQAQAAAIEQFASRFSRDWNLKNLLVDMMMSPWFRTTSTTRTDKRAALELADVGTEKLLTPERLYNKTLALTGFGWGRSVSPPATERLTTNNFSMNYGGLYGGIDSFAVTRRQRDMTPMMSSVAQSMASESACPIVLHELLLPDVKRLLFQGMTLTETPLREAASVMELPSKDKNDWHTISLTTTLPVGSHVVSVGLDNPYCDFDAVAQRCRSQRVLYLDRFEIRAPGQSTFQRIEITADVASNYKPQCYRDGTNNALTFAPCRLDYTFTGSTAGEYEIRAIVAGPQAGTGLMQVSMTVEDTAEPLLSSSASALMIKQRLVDLHNKLWGEQYTLDSPEIADAWALFVSVWQSRRQLNNANMFFPESCFYFSDDLFFEGTSYPGNPHVLNAAGAWEWDHANTNNFVSAYSSDSTGTKRAWVVVMAYLLGHYKYLYE